MIEYGYPKLNSCVPKSGLVTRKHSSELLVSLPAIFIEMYNFHLTLILLISVIYDMYYK
jgi:hypothetical protein